MDTLVACPVSGKKDYCIERWAQATSGFPRLVALDSRERYATRLKKLKLPFVTFDTEDDSIYGPMFNDAWRAIIENAGARTHILSLDVDVFSDTDILSLMEENWDDHYSFLCHGVPWRGKPWRKTLSYEMSCTLGSVPAWREALARADEKKEPLYRSVHSFLCKDFTATNLTHLDKE